MSIQCETLHKVAMKKAKASAKEKAERITTSDPGEKEAATQRKEESKTLAQLNKEEAHSHNEEACWVAEAGGRHPGYKTWGTEGYPTTGVAGTVPTTTTITTDAEYDAPAITGTGSTGDYATIPTGPATADRRHPRGPVLSDAPRFT